MIREHLNTILLGLLLGLPRLAALCVTISEVPAEYYVVEPTGPTHPQKNFLDHTGSMTGYVRYA